MGLLLRTALCHFAPPPLIPSYHRSFCLSAFKYSLKIILQPLSFSLFVFFFLLFHKVIPCMTFLSHTVYFFSGSWRLVRICTFDLYGRKKKSIPNTQHKKNENNKIKLCLCSSQFPRVPRETLSNCVFSLANNI